MRRSCLTTVFIALTLTMGGLWLSGCEGDQGPAGPSGVNPQSSPIITAVVAAPDSVGSRESTTLFVSAYDPNGDEMSYAWTADAGTLSDPNAAVTQWTAPSELDLYQISVTVSDDDGSVSGTVTVGVNVYVPAVFPSYLGDNFNRCAHCHDAKVEGWHETNHSHATQTLRDIGMDNNLFCMSCHTTGFDDVYDHDGNFISTGVDNGGWDDNPITELENVQCESCHGPTGPSFASHEPSSADARTGEACAKCHDQHEEYLTSTHGMSIENAGGHEAFIDEWGRSYCWTCHISEGFLMAYDPDWAGSSLPEDAYQVTCATCHDIHEKENDAYLRGLQAIETPYGGEEFPTGLTITDWGYGQLCGQCHHARRDEEDVMDQINEGDDHPGPHPSPQTDMLAGYGSYEIPGYEYEREANHGTSLMPNMCVDCHMYSIPREEEGGPLFGHSFNPDIRKCQQCHTGATDFDIDDVQSDVEELLEELFALLPNNGTELLPFDTLNWTRAEREAGYAYFFVEEDGSHGVHNEEYAKSLLENAIDYLTNEAATIRRDRVKG